MQQSQKYLIFLDIDGTIWEHGMPIHERTVEAVRKARKLGHKVFINTGRSYGFIPPHVFEAMDFDGVIAGLGSDIRFGGKQVFSLCVDTAVLKATFDFMLKNGKKGMFEGESRVYGINISNPDFVHINDEQAFFDNFSAQTPENKISKIHIRGILTDSEREFLENFYTVIQHETYSEMSIPTVNKASGMDFVLDYLSHEGPFKIIACGDSMNDTQMLERADIGVAMGNSVEPLKQMADLVTVSAGNGGVGEALEKLLGV